MKTYRKNWVSFAVLVVGILLGGLWLFHPARAAGPWYVAPGGDDTNDCLTPATPCETINGSIGKATAGDTVYVATGTYTSAGEEVVFIDRDIILSGGWNDTFSTQDGMSIVDAQGVRRGVMVNNSVTSSIVERFIIQNGNAFGGGGIASYGNLTVNNSTLANNVSLQSGGALLTQNSVITLNTVIFTNNTAMEQGGGIYNFNSVITLNDTTLMGGNAFQGGGIYNENGGNAVINITNSLLSGNSATTSGGGIFNSGGTLIVTDTILSSNVASTGDGGGIWNSSILTITASTVVSNTALSGSGGGFCCGGMVKVTDSSILHNMALNGGGMWNGLGQGLEIRNSTLSDNRAIDDGGGIFNTGTIFGGGILNLNNVTISYNMTDQDTNGTGNGGGIFSSPGELYFRNTLVAANVDTGGQASDCAGPMTSQGYNLIQNPSGCTIVGDPTGNLIGLDPMLDSLQDNGGPTLTHALLPGSPAIDAGNPATPGSGGNACETTDQRGVTRPQLSACDIGAFELESSSPIVKFSNSPYSVNEDASTSLITVTASSNLTQTATVDYSTSDGTATAGEDYLSVTGTFTFTPSTLVQTFTVTITDDFLLEGNETVLLALTNPVNIVLGTPNSSVLTIVEDEPFPVAQFSQSFFNADENTATASLTVTLDMASPLTTTLDYSTQDGTAIAGDDYFPAFGTLTFPPGVQAQTLPVTLLEDAIDEADETITVTLSNPTNAVLGFPDSATLTIVDNDLPPTPGPRYVTPTGDDHADCQTPATACETINGALLLVVAGDTIYVAEGIYTNTVGSEVVRIDKEITLSGGWNTNFTAQDGMSTIDGQGARRGMLVEGSGVIMVERFNIQNGSTVGEGAGIFNSSVSSLTLNNTSVTYNTSLYSGGGIQNYGTLAVVDSTLSNNLAIYFYGGGLSNQGTLSLMNSLVSNNSAYDGGGIYNSGTLTMDSSGISGNTSQDTGGGISNSSTLTLNNSTIHSNGSSNAGGGISNHGGTVTITASEFSYNVGANSGGGLYNNGMLTITESTFSMNSGYVGGAIFSFNGSFIITYSTFANNSAMSGGGIYSSGNLGTATVTNSTLSNNYGGDQGGGISNSIPFTLTNSTVYGNNTDGSGGGLFSSPVAPIILQNTILAGNTSAGSSPDCSGTVNSQGYNLIQETSGCTLEGDTTGNLTGVDPNLGPLQGNGGPTWTHAILPDSPALDAGNPATPGSGGHACAATDQRGVLRPQGVACDMGAFELEQPPVVHFTASDYDVAEDAGTVTITVTLTAASNLTATVTYTTANGTALAGSDYTSITGTLTFAPGTLTQTITVMLTDDALEEEDETFSLTLSAPVNAVLGTPASATITIVDNEEVTEFKVYLPLILK